MDVIKQLPHPLLGVDYTASPLQQCLPKINTCISNSIKFGNQKELRIRSPYRESFVVMSRKD